MLIYQSIVSGNLQALQHAVSSGEDVHQTDAKGRTPLLVAAYFDRADMVEWLLEKGAQLDSKDRHRRTALHWAAYGDAKTSTTLLLAKGLDDTLKDAFGWTAIHLAAARDTSFGEIPPRPSFSIEDKHTAELASDPEPAMVPESEVSLNFSWLFSDMPKNQKLAVLGVAALLFLVIFTLSIRNTHHTSVNENPQPSQQTPAPEDNATPSAYNNPGAEVQGTSSQTPPSSWYTHAGCLSFRRDPWVSSPPDANKIGNFSCGAEVVATGDPANGTTDCHQGWLPVRYGETQGWLCLGNTNSNLYKGTPPTADLCSEKKKLLIKAGRSRCAYQINP